LCGSAWDIVLQNRRAEKAAAEAAEKGEEGWSPS
jgi:hypothetical protein